MSFTSIPFLLFFAVTTILYFLLPQKFRCWELLFASCFFYGYSRWELLFLLLGVTVVSYLGGILVERIPKRKSLLTWIFCLLLLSVLVVFKYLNFLSEIVLSVVQSSASPLSILLPAGISFYTLQSISYLVDVRKGKLPAEKNFLYYSLYIAFFPQLVAGPIERSTSMLPQFRNLPSPDADGILLGFRYLVLGFFEKIVIADFAGLYVTATFDNLSTSNGLEILLSTVLFSVQILCDFKGYSDIAIGIADIYGIQLTQNFNHPYRAESIRDFWRRWHITFSGWLKDYIYIPLGGSHEGSFRYLRNILFVFLLSGLWHGASFTFLLWGLGHGILIVADHFLTHKGIFQGKWMQILHHILAVTEVSLLWILFRSNTLEDAGIAYSRLLTSWSTDTSLFSSVFTHSGWTPLLLLLCLGLVLFYFLQEPLVEYFRPKRCGKLIRFLVYSFMMVSTITVFIALQCQGVASNFIYFQF